MPKNHIRHNSENVESALDFKSDKKKSGEIRLRGERVGEVLKKMRGETSLSALERMTHIDKATLMRFESGERGFSSDEFVTIARALQCNVPLMLKECFAAAFEGFGARYGEKLFVNVLDAIAQSTNKE